MIDTILLCCHVKLFEKIYTEKFYQNSVNQFVLKMNFSIISHVYGSWAQ